MDETTNMKLKKPVENEYISVGIINGNMDIIDAGMKEISDSVDAPEFDATGTVEGITDKEGLLASFVTRMPLVKFMRNVVAGFKLVLYAGQVVNNCVTDNASLPLSAAQGKVLMDLYTVLNTNLINPLVIKTFTYSQSITLAPNGGQEIRIPITVPDGYMFLCVTNVKSNGNVAYACYIASSSNVLTCFVGNDRNEQKIIPQGISADALFVKKWW